MFKDVFKERINELCRDQGTSASAMAKKAGISAGSMNYYLSGERRPDATALHKICIAFNVSADWLLGISDIRTKDIDFRNACNTLGLSEKAAKTLLREQGEELNHLLECSEEDWDIIHYYLSNYLHCRKDMIPSDLKDGSSIAMPGIISGGHVLLSSVQGADYFARVVGDCVYNALAKDIKDSMRD